MDPVLTTVSWNARMVPLNLSHVHTVRFTAIQVVNLADARNEENVMIRATATATRRFAQSRDPSLTYPSRRSTFTNLSPDKVISRERRPSSVHAAPSLPVTWRTTQPELEGLHVRLQVGVI